ARVTAAPGLLYAGDTDLKIYLVGYDGTRIQRIGSLGDSFTITPDGKLVTVTPLKTVHIRKLNLKQSPDASPAKR
ncbi:MAG TPA: hypothetical protein VMZ50_04770, partial [Phycisphaerae bacterium]|nr:hypothetical protein [Phycisphaerae bacterium]